MGTNLTNTADHFDKSSNSATAVAGGVLQFLGVALKSMDSISFDSTEEEIDQNATITDEDVEAYTNSNP